VFDFKEREVIKSFFNDSGYVFDFSNSRFSDFCRNSIGVDLQEKYNLSKGKSLSSFLDEENGEKSLKLVQDLLWYYNHLPDSSEERSKEKDRIAEKILKIVEEKKENYSSHH